MPRALWLAVLTVSFPVLAAEEVAPAPLRVAVLDIAATGVDENTARTFSEILTVEIGRLPGVKVISNAEILNLVGLEAQKQMLGCDEDASCVAEIAGALGVDKLCSGSLGKVEDTTVLSLRLLDVKSASVDHRLYETENSASAFISRMPDLVQRLFPEKGEEPAPRVAERDEDEEEEQEVVATRPEPQSSGGRPLLLKPWFWAAVGGGLLLIGGAAASTAEFEEDFAAGVSLASLGVLVGLGSGGMCLFQSIAGGGGDAPVSVLQPLSSPFEMPAGQ